MIRACAGAIGGRVSGAVLIWLLLLGLSGAILVRGFAIDDDLTLFLPNDTSSVQHLLLGRLREGPQARTLLIALEGADVAARAAASRAAADDLRELPGIARVENGAHHLDPAAAAPLFERRYLLADFGPLDREALRAALEARLRELQAPFGAPDKELLAADPTAQLRRLLDRWLETSRPPKRADGVWVSPEGARALLLAETTAAGLDLRKQAALVGAVRERLGAIESRYGVDALMTGPTVFAAAAADATRAEAARFGLLGSALVVGLLLLAFRSWRIVVLGLVPLGSGVLVAIAAVHLVYGSIHGITLAFGITLLGVAIDYPLHLFSHARAGQDLAATAARVWPPLRLGMLTTVLGYAAMASPEFGGLAQLALFASTGLLGAGLCLRYVLPALWPGPAPSAAPWLRPDLGLIGRRWWWTLRIALLVAVTTGAISLATRGAGPFATDLAGLTPVPETARALDQELRSALGVPDLRHLLLLRADTLEAALQLAESIEPELQALQEAGALGNYELISRYLPSEAMQQARREQLPATEVLAREVAAAQSGLPFRPATFAPFLEAVERNRALAPVTSGDFAGTPLAAKLESLLARDGSDRYVFVPLVDVRDAEAVARLATADEAILHADLKRLSEATVNQLRERALERLGLGLGVVLLVLIVGLRQWRRVLAVGGSLALALVLAAAILVGLGERLSLFHIVAGLLVVGIGVDYGVFFGWPSADLDRRRTLGAVLLCVLSTVAVFGALATSGIPVLSSIGLTVTIGTLVAFASALALVWSPSTARAGDGTISPG